VAVRHGPASVRFGWSTSGCTGFGLYGLRASGLRAVRASGKPASTLGQRLRQEPARQRACVRRSRASSRPVFAGTGPWMHRGRAARPGTSVPHANACIAPRLREYTRCPTRPAIRWKPSRDLGRWMPTRPTPGKRQEFSGCGKVAAAVEPTMARPASSTGRTTLRAGQLDGPDQVAGRPWRRRGGKARGRSARAAASGPHLRKTTGELVGGVGFRGHYNARQKRRTVVTVATCCHKGPARWSPGFAGAYREHGRSNER
jgi:hypothetical protein